MAAFQQKAVDPALPYIQKQIEYPVIIGVFIHLMGLSGSEYYYIISSIFLTIFAIITSLFLYRIVDILKIDKKKITQFWILTPTLLFFAVYNWDIIAVMFVSISFYFFLKKSPVKSAVALSLGVSSKLFPIVFLIPLLMKTEKEKRAKLILAFVAAFLAVNSYFMLANFDGWMFTYNFHSTRTANIDSVFGIAQFFFQLGPPIVNLISLGLFGISYILLIAIKRKADFFRLCFLSILLFLLFNKVFSPQFLIWMLMFFVIFDFKKKVFYSLEILNLMVLFSILWFYTYVTVIEALYLSFLFVIVRHAILFYIIYRVLKLKTTTL